MSNAFIVLKQLRMPLQDLFAYVLPVINAPKLTIYWSTEKQNHGFPPSDPVAPIWAPPGPRSNLSSPWRFDNSVLGVHTFTSNWPLSNWQLPYSLNQRLADFGPWNYFLTKSLRTIFGRTGVRTCEPRITNPTHSLLHYRNPLAKIHIVLNVP